jgi:putative oxidoreductase
MLWALQAVLALQFATAGGLKLAGTNQMVEMFNTIGAGQWLRYAIGVVEIAGAVGLLIAPLSGLAALGLVGLMVGATATNLFIIDANPWMPVTYLLVAAVIAWGRWPRTKTLAGTFRRDAVVNDGQQQRTAI